MVLSTVAAVASAFDPAAENRDSRGDLIIRSALVV